MGKIHISYIGIFIIYFISHFGILIIPNAIYWDDWILVHSSTDKLFEEFKLAGSFLNFGGYLHCMLLYIGPWSYKILTFVLMFCSGIILKKILNKCEFICKNSQILIILFFLILPFNSARVALINFPYTLSLFLFLMAWFFMGKNRLLSLSLFFLSFNTQSFLVFYTIPFFYYFYYTNNQVIKQDKLLKFSYRNLDYLILPFVFFILKITFFIPYGIYEGYNENYSLYNIFLGFIRTFLYTLTFEIKFIPFIFIFLSTLFFSKKYIKKDFIFSSNYLVILGIFILILGAFPYWVVGHSPSFHDWNSRHQLLFPIGTSLFLVGLLNYIKTGYKKLYISCIVTLSILLNLNNYKDFYFDWKKQEIIISLLREENAISSANYIVFDDRSMQLNANNRYYRDYEWNGIVAEAFNNSSVLCTSLNKYESNSSIFTDSTISNNSLNSRPSVFLVTINYRGGFRSFFMENLSLNLHYKFIT